MSLLARIVALVLFVLADIGVTPAGVTELELFAFGLAAWVTSTIVPA